MEISLSHEDPLDTCLLQGDSAPASSRVRWLPSRSGRRTGTGPRSEERKRISGKEPDRHR